MGSLALSMLVLGTAGHVDHGKSALVRALTGTDPDRLAEEKRRGITIDLGFARFDAGGGREISVVDVPGHEAFVRTMVAGASGLDAAMLVVAADEGIMPQTEEHLAILEFLGVPAGIPVISKVDLVDPDWLELVLTDVRARLAESSLAWQEPVAVSVVSGEGLAELRASLARLEPSRRVSDDVFRMPVDRAFTVAGTGTVVTGTVWSGTLDVGTDVIAFPGNVRARVRALEVHGVPVGRAAAGSRLAVALAGVAREAASRGSVLVAGRELGETGVADIELRLATGVAGIGARTRVRVHLGTAEVMARYTPAGPRFGRLRFESPIVARWGDVGVIRSYSPVTTIAGFRVIDPRPPVRPGRPVNPEGMAAPELAVRLRAAASISSTLSAADLVQRLGATPSEAASLVAAPPAGVAVVGGVFHQALDLETARAASVRAVNDWHRANPADPGMPLGSFREVAGSVSLAERVLADAGDVLVHEAGFVRLRAFEPHLSGTLAPLAARLLAAVRDGGREGRDLASLRDVLGEDGLRSVLDHLVRHRQLVRVPGDRFYEPAVAAEMREQVLTLLQARGQAAPSELRDALGISRKFLMPFLEWLDSEGVTRRDGDRRVPGPRG